MIPFLAGLVVGILAGFFVGAAAVQARLIWPHRRQARLPWHSLRGGMLYLPGDRRRAP